MNRRYWVLPAVGLAGLGLTACDVKPSINQATGVGTTVQSTTNPAMNAQADIGAPLYAPPAKDPPTSAAPGAAAEAIVVSNCQVTVPYTENVPSKNDGKFFDVVTELQPGELERLPPSEVFTHPFDAKRKYRRLHEGDAVVPGQLVALLDDRVAKNAEEGARANLFAAQNSVSASKEAVKASSDQLEIQVRLGKMGVPGASSPLELAEFTKRNAESKKALADSQGLVEKAGPELQKAIITLQDHEIRATIGGVVKAIYKRPGEAVKALEPVLQLQNQSQLRVEGLLNVQTLARLKNARGAKVVIEPAPRQAGIELVGHWKPVTAVDVSKDVKKPLIVSASEDKTVRVWDRSVQKANWSHPAGVQAVACTGPKSSLNLVLSGADDGVARLWDLNNLAADKPLRELKGHDARINSVAFSPDGQFCATADNNKVKVWATADGKLKYEFLTDHRGPISSVQFTPQVKLVTAARDRTLRVWSLGDKAAKIDSVIENRAGNVAVLDVSPDGQHVMFDQNKALHVLSMKDQRTEAVLPSPSESSQFHAFAVFSPDSRLILAGGNGDSPLQLWRAPAPGVRPQQIRRLALNGLATCAAFSPDGSFAVTGAEDYRVYLWEMPTTAEVSARLEGRITNLDRSIDSTDQKVRVWAEVDNANGQLLPGDTVSMVLTPSDGR